MDIISADDLALWLRDASLSDDDSFVQIVDLTNALIADEWATPATPVPTKIQLLAFGVASRAWTHNPANANLESVTRAIDDASRTERYRSPGTDQNVYLTADERAILKGQRPVGSVRLVTAGTLPWTWPTETL